MRESYIDAVYVKSVDRIKKRGSYKPQDEDLRDANKQSIHHKYIETGLNMNVSTFIFKLVSIYL